MDNLSTKINHFSGSDIIFDGMRAKMWGFIADKRDESGWHKAGYFFAVPGVTLVDETLKVARDTSAVAELAFKGLAWFYKATQESTNRADYVKNGADYLFVGTTLTTALLGLRILILPVNLYFGVFLNHVNVRSRSDELTAKALSDKYAVKTCSWSDKSDYKKDVSNAIFRTRSEVKTTYITSKRCTPVELRQKAEGYTLSKKEEKEFYKASSKRYAKVFNLNKEAKKNLYNYLITPDSKEETEIKKLNKKYDNGRVQLFKDIKEKLKRKDDDTRIRWIEDQLSFKEYKKNAKEHKKEIKKAQSDAVKAYVKDCESKIFPPKAAVATPTPTAVAAAS
jgi:hypothetical protein